jgi:RHS repeat-associated protein
VVTSATFTANAWHTVFAWHDAVNNTINIQIDNGTVNSLSYSGGAMDTTYPLTIGAHIDSGYVFNGRVDEVSLYKRILPAAERTWLYNAGTGRAYSELTSSPVIANAINYTYGDPNHVHAVKSLTNGNTYEYDANGNMIQRHADGKTYGMAYDAENQLVKVCEDANNNKACDSGETVTATFMYDADGRRVQSVIGVDTILFVGAHYEIKNGSEITKYYLAGATRVAMRKYTIPQNMTLEYTLSDQLGSASLTTDANGAKISEIRYKAWGEIRATWTNAPVNISPAYSLTKYTYTGQYSDSYINLLWYGSRHYDPALGRFIQPDSIVPLASQGTQAYDRYAYTNNNPVRYTDPTGHSIGPVFGAIFLGCVIAGGILAYDIFTTSPTKADRVPAPTSKDVTSWTVDRINDTASSPVMKALQDNWASPNPLNKAGALKAWVGLVTENGIWDYKKDINGAGILSAKGNVAFGDTKMNFQAVANATYGMYAADMGLPQWLGESGAGVAQLSQDPKTSGGFDTYGDDPYDNYWVKFGYWFYKQYGSDFGSLTPADLKNGINTYNKTYGVPPDPLATGH